MDTLVLIIGASGENGRGTCERAMACLKLTLMSMMIKTSVSTYPLIFSSFFLLFFFFTRLAQSTTSTTSTPTSSGIVGTIPSSSFSSDSDYKSNEDKEHRPISPRLYNDLEELSRLVDIAYCVGTTGIEHPFLCAGRCQEFPGVELVTVCLSTYLFLSELFSYGSFIVWFISTRIVHLSAGVVCGLYKTRRSLDFLFYIFHVAFWALISC